MEPTHALPKKYSPWCWAAHLVLAGYWLMLFGATHYPRVALPTAVPYVDKVAHFVAYGLLSLFYFTAANVRHSLRKADFVRGWLVLASYGVADELLQIPVGRSCELLDWVADISGALVGLALFAGLVSLRRFFAGDQKFGVGGR
jgi:VanZ family protein